MSLPATLSTYYTRAGYARTKAEYRRLAAALAAQGVTVRGSTVQAWLLGRRGLSLSQLRAVARVCAVGPKELRGLEDLLEATELTKEQS